jgi:hypothetical protein
MKRDFYWLVLLFFSLRLSAQTDERGYSEALVYGLNFNTIGGMIGGGMLHFSRARGAHQYEGLYFELVNIKDSKEYRIRTIDNKSFIPYKTHYLFSFRPSYVRELVLFRKAAEEGIFVNLLAGAGPSIAIRKKYYVYYDETGNGDWVSRPYEAGMDLSFISQNAPFADGLGDLSFGAGLHGRIALNLEFGQLKSSVAGLEAGLLAEKFAVQQSMMAFKPSGSFFTTAYLTLYFGRKY